MARILAWTALMAGAYATSHEQGGQSSGLPVVLSTESSQGGHGYGGGYGGSGYGYGGSGSGANIQVGITIITTNDGGGAQNQEWNNPEMDAGMTHEVSLSPLHFPALY